MESSNLIDYYGSDAGRRFLSRQTWALAIAAIALCATFGDGRIDLAISSRFFDDAQHAFPLTNQWLLKVALHDAARAVSAIAALTLVGLAVASWCTTRSQRLHGRRRELLFAAGACFIGAAAVGILKHCSAHACPWDLALFGGTEAYHPLFAAAAAPSSVHGCSPAAHPLAGYAWLGVGFALAPRAARSARLAWLGACALGTGFGIVQILRGAHFASHVLWSAWTVWAVNLALLAICVYAPRRLRSPSRVWRPAASTR